MTATDVPTDLTDPELISQVREGDVTAYGTLFSRHVDAATRLARQLVSGPDADDLVSESFVKVLGVLLAGGGPDVAFRAYLLTAVRRLHVDKLRSTARATPTEDLTPYDPGVPFTDTAIAGFEGGAAAKAYASLPERWQLVLWHLEVENQKPADIAPLLGMSANAVSALAYRAREGLRQAFLNMHSGDLVSEGCRETHDLLGGYVRGGLAKRDSARVETHLDRCRRCTGIYLELAEVNTSLAGVLGPALLGTAAAGYLGGGAALGSGAGAGVLALLGRGRDLVLSNAAASATAGVVGVAASAGIALTVVTHHHQQHAPVVVPDAAAAVPARSASTPQRSPHSSVRAPHVARPRHAPASAHVAAPSPPASLSPSAVVTTPSLPDPEDLRSTLPDVPTQVGVPGHQQDPGSPAPPAGHTRQPDAGPGPSGGTDGTGTGTGTGTGGATGPGSTGSTGSGSGGDPGGAAPSPTPAPRSADVSISGWASPVHEEAFWVRGRVSGVPTGQRVTVTVTSTGGTLRPRDAGPCRGGGRSYVCDIGRGGRPVSFDVAGAPDATVTFTVSAPAGWSDPDSGNNSASVRAVHGG